MTAYRVASDRPSASRATATVMFGIGVSRLFGLVREQVIAFYFGRAASYSAFVAAYKIPNLVRVLLGEGNLSASFIPVLADRMQNPDSNEARRLAQSVLGLLLLTVGVVTILGVLAAPALAWVVAPGFDPVLRALVERLIRYLFPTVAFLVVGAWCMGVLHAHGRFFWPNFAPMFWSVISAGALIAFVGRTWMAPVMILAWGVVVGSLVQLLVQLPATRAAIGTLAPRLRWRDPAVRRVVTLFGPMMIGTGVAQISTLIDIQIASFLDDGGVAALAYAQRLYLLPLSLFGVSIAQVALPTLAHESATSGADPGALRDEFRRAWLRMTFFLLPSAIVLVAYGRPAVSLIFERGRFGAGDTNVVMFVLAAYALGLLAYGSVRLLATAFHALQDTRTPVRIAAIALVANAVLGIGLAYLIGLPGIGLATAIAAGLNAVLLRRNLATRIGPVFGSTTMTDFRKMAFAAGAAAAAALIPYVWILQQWGAWGLGDRVLAAAVLFGGYGLLYIGAAAILRVSVVATFRS